QITGEAGAVIILHKAAHPIDVGVYDKQARCSPSRFMRGEKTAIVINGRVRTQAANQAEASAFFASRIHVERAIDICLRSYNASIAAMSPLAQSRHSDGAD